ncbi:sugar transferase [Tropicimonas marinistellae]|uniref:sugar transferase n=1 Tax=Tropicimonas marinistellae TaxID=1739787 RepID=UPI001F401400|nr:sugar transferase [Tropicimonas marinistellae]
MDKLGGSGRADTIVASLPTGKFGGSQVYPRAVKPSVEFLIIVATAPITLALVFILALLIATDGSNPFYTQVRVGRNGKLFRIWKLRTMVPNADRMLAAYLASDDTAREEWEKTQKLKKDPRVTRLGRFLRKSSLDELPQLFNVLNGTMSLVGPRPMLVNQQESYPGSSYYKMKPGITGVWQVYARNESGFSQRAKYDDLYHRVMSWRTDATLLFKTVGVVFRSTGH